MESDNFTTYLVKNYPDLFSDNIHSGEREPNIWVPEGWQALVSGVCDVLVQGKTKCQSEIDFYESLIEGDVDDATQQKYLKSITENQTKIQNLEFPKIVQIKEKFGELRVYLANSTPEQEACVGFATTVSRKTCQKCGALGHGRSTKSRYYVTSCDEHFDNYYNK